MLGALATAVLAIGGVTAYLPTLALYVQLPEIVKHQQQQLDQQTAILDQLLRKQQWDECLATGKNPNICIREIDEKQEERRRARDAEADE